MTIRDDRDELLLPRSVQRADLRAEREAELEEIFGEDILTQLPILERSPSTGLSALLDDQPEAEPAKPKRKTKTAAEKLADQLAALVAEDAATHGPVQSAWKDQFSREVLVVTFEGCARVSPQDHGHRIAVYKRPAGDPTWSLRVGPDGAPPGLQRDVGARQPAPQWELGGSTGGRPAVELRGSRQSGAGVQGHAAGCVPAAPEAARGVAPPSLERGPRMTTFEPPSWGQPSEGSSRRWRATWALGEKTRHGCQSL